MASMAAATHATVMTLRRDLSKADEQAEVFRQMFERGFAAIPGFVSGLCTFDPEACESVIIHTFDALSSAKAFAAMARDNAERQAPLGLGLGAVAVTQVTGTA